jgi:hypothetical protein
VISRRPVRPLGDEGRRPLPGNALLPNAKGRWTHGVTIQAPPSAIWPWLLQMGCRRGGWYSYFTSIVAASVSEKYMKYVCRALGPSAPRRWNRHRRHRGP